ncbi:hypothetical protein KAFR_0J02510 [Kazachstania africana CBS 2517]|uniref:Uncharacterized protein n=1 Tax=Kazachstania africana (strain ATCC 22294 / BCRC 22015 / CBS 2517 / CECT 1963 / NBRC 1671 / NRRL Y-8276) TaxID=1071382 RepID=H2B115_KAZAF|nr:hypothetical protein KAFR_0J02510 [Kazachstania africana CBS 2517]CCF60315.1 hypothetical protein KAFR_0J02510 [Kazachstania africana CBS 2517]
MVVKPIERASVCITAMSALSNIVEPMFRFAERIGNMNADYFNLTYEEQKAMSFFERVRAYNWQFEAFAVGMMVLIFVSFKYGTMTNSSRASKLFGSIHEFLRNDLNFARVGFATATRKTYLDAHLQTWFTSFATGRSTIESVAIKCHLLGRHNPLAILAEHIIRLCFPTLQYGDELNDYVEISIKPNGVYVANENANVNGNAKEVLSNFKFITSIVNKSFMTKVRRDNFFLSLTYASENEKLPKEYAYMSEINQLNDFIPGYISKGKLTEVLAKSTNLLQFISFTDLPSEKPVDEQQWNANIEPRCVIRANVPTNSKDLKTLNDIIAIAVEIYDNFTRDLVQKKASTLVTSDILRKNINFRNQELQKIIKSAKDAELEIIKEQQREIEKEKKRELRKTGQQANIDQKMKEKRERRARNKQKTRM